MSSILTALVTEAHRRGFDAVRQDDALTVNGPDDVVVQYWIEDNRLMCWEVGGEFRRFALATLGHGEFRKLLLPMLGHGEIDWQTYGF
jgi:hypothetical protein